MKFLSSPQKYWNIYFKTLKHFVQPTSMSFNISYFVRLWEYTALWNFPMDCMRPLLLIKLHVTDNSWHSLPVMNNLFLSLQGILLLWHLCISWTNLKLDFDQVVVKKSYQCLCKLCELMVVKIWFRWSSVFFYTQILVSVSKT